MQRRSIVAVVRCETYADAEVSAAVAAGIELLGGIGQFVKPGETLLLKPNLLAPDSPEKCVTTHPAVFAAVAEKFLAAKVKLVYGDSPGLGAPRQVAQRTGILERAENLGLSLADFTSPVEVPFPAGLQHKRFTLAAAAARHRGAIVNLPKFKTHGFMRLTSAVKNLFGCVPGLLKAEYHVKLPDAHAFARMLVDLNLLLGARLHVLDGIQAMEGNGPRSGTPLHLGVLLFSADPVALDATAARLIGLNPGKIPTTRYGAAAGLGHFAMDEIDVRGEPLVNFRPRSFQIDHTPIPETAAGARKNWLKARIVPRPVIQAKRCTRCGTCVKICPVAPKALAWRDAGHIRPPAYDYQKCIRCYCCQEMCPEKAIVIKTPWLGKWIRRA
jgi:uncharacterized protein (DUF362 family)/NAD-dependent dihydropyrimidine dehydrogenase PreA subunit